MEQENQPEKIQFVIVPEFILTDSNIPIGEKLLFGDIASHTKQRVIIKSCGLAKIA